MVLLSLVAIVTQWTYTYTNSIQYQTFYQGCTYEVELWGANGGRGCGDGNCAYTGGTGAYIKGRVTLSTTTEVGIVVGGKGADAVASNPQGGSGGYNGGGGGGKDTGILVADNDPSGGGGGATDLRLHGVGRIMAAGAGSGGVCQNNGAHGGAENEHGFVMENHQVAYSSGGGTGSSSGGNGVDAMVCPGSGGGAGWEGGKSDDYVVPDYHDGVGKSGSSGCNNQYVTKLDVKRGDQSIASQKPDGNGYAIVKLTNWQNDACKVPKPTLTRSISPSPSLFPTLTIQYVTTDLGNDTVMIGDGTGSEANGVKMCPDGGITVPESIYGKTVVAIADCAFCGCPIRGPIVIPSQILRIGARAFGGCKRVTALSIWAGSHSGGPQIGEGAFEDLGSEVGGEGMTVELPREVDLSKSAFAGANVKSIILK